MINQTQSIMYRLNLAIIYDISAILNPLTKLEGAKKRKKIILMIDTAHKLLANIHEYFYFHSSFNDIQNTLQILNDFLQEEDLSIEATKNEIDNIRLAAIKLELSLKNELSIQPSYLVTSKSEHDLDRLTRFPQFVFPNALIKKFPSTEYDVIECCKALAFELPTACGFHLMRIIEVVIREHCVKLGLENKDKLDSKTLGQLVCDFEKYLDTQIQSNKTDHKISPERKLIRVVRELTETDRNPIVHGKVNMSIDDALILFRKY